MLIDAKNAPIYANTNGKGMHQYFSDDPTYTVIGESNGWYMVRHHSQPDGVTGLFKKSDVEPYKKNDHGNVNINIYM